MRVLDTNILVRWLVNDDPGQAARVRALLRKARREKRDLHIPDPVMIETVWVLESAYGLGRESIREAMEAVVLDGSVRLDHPRRLARALDFYAYYGVGFVDAYVAVTAMEHEKGAVVSFDRGFKKLPVPWIEP